MIARLTGPLILLVLSASGAFGVENTPQAIEFPELDGVGGESAEGESAGLDPAGLDPAGSEHAASGRGSFWSSADLWVAVGFALFVIGVFKPVKKFITTALDGRAGNIRAELDEAQRLREEAQHTLAEYQRKQRDALKEAEAIIAEARKEAQRIRENAAERTDTTLKRREQQALDMIAAAEARAVSEVRALTADVAVDATRRILETSVDGAKGDALIEDAIRDVPSKLN